MIGPTPVDLACHSQFSCINVRAALSEYTWVDTGYSKSSESRAPAIIRSSKAGKHMCLLESVAWFMTVLCGGLMLRRASYWTIRGTYRHSQCRLLLEEQRLGHDLHQGHQSFRFRGLGLKARARHGCLKIRAGSQVFVGMQEGLDPDKEYLKHEVHL